MAIAIGASISWPGRPSPKASGTRPSAAISAVMNTGAKRSAAAMRIVWRRPGPALLVDEMLDVRQHHHRVARADAEHGDEPDEAAERQADAAGHDRRHAADRGRTAR